METYKTQQELQAIRRRKRADEETGAAVTALLIIAAVVTGVVYYRKHKQVAVTGVDSFIQTKDFDLLFAYNENTSYFYENNDFPEYERDLRSLKWQLEDFVDNAKYFGEFDPDKSFVIGLKNGAIVHVENENPQTILRTIKPSFVEQGKYSFIVYNDVGYLSFWFNGMDGLQQLQEYTGWFDMDLYEDWL